MAKPLLLGRKEIAKLYNIAPTAVSDRWVPDGILSYEDAAIVSGKPFWPGGFIIDLALPPGSGGRQLDETALAALVEEQQATVRPKKKGELPALVGAQEYGELFGVTQVAVGQAALRGNGMIPEPDYVLSGSKVWLLYTVLNAAETTMNKSRKGTWRLQEAVVEALSEGRYEGRGSSIAKRGVAAQKAE
ncbi:hypothetical protein [Streptomyces natalensis]|uniref:Uncharacterized protein n=1 Tax=Streptomyces natalensis ATCC 27448 TaxID=1240678 RepID=A0A0D7CHA6_9ACTN|nr:hypothetical protein [Streptomyces natalensis]KIZ15431.1 hypothetical protein SNA_28175 [Streptomyces natalensis ATCC 27448]